MCALRRRGATNAVMWLAFVFGGGGLADWLGPLQNPRLVLGPCRMRTLTWKLLGVSCRSPYDAGRERWTRAFCFFDAAVNAVCPMHCVGLAAADLPISHVRASDWPCMVGRSWSSADCSKPGTTLRGRGVGRGGVRWLLGNHDEPTLCVVGLLLRQSR